MKWLPVLAVFFLGAAAGCGAETNLTFSCAADNDLYMALGGHHYPRFRSPSEAIRQAPEGSAALLLADRYPDQTVYVAPDEFALARKKNLRLYIEYPAELPGLEVAMTRTSRVERVVVSSDRLGSALPTGRTMLLPDCHHLPVIGSPKADLILTHVGATGAPEGRAYPILFELPGQNLIAGMTQLSGFVRGRFAPFADWQAVWQEILGRLAPANPPLLAAKPIIWPAFNSAMPLPPNAEQTALDEAASWLAQSHLLVDSISKQTFDLALNIGMETTTPENPGEPEGDGSLGIMEGYGSEILSDGSQFRRLPIRADCNTESAMVLALDGALNGQSRSKTIATHLLDFVFKSSGLCAGDRDDRSEPAFGLIAASDVAPAGLAANPTDGNGRCILATLVAGTALHSDQWNRFMVRALLANFRTTGKLGFRLDTIDMADLKTNGWKFYHDAAVTNNSPQMESFLWACNLWAYHETGYKPFLDRTINAIAMTMARGPLPDNAARARMLLSLAWLTRVEDTAEHRNWLARVANELIARQQPCGSIRDDNNPVCNLFDTAGFALLGLHEAVGVTGDKTWLAAEDKLAAFLCRAQWRSDHLRWLDGAWPRTFEDQRWDAWDAFAGTGAGPAWASAVFAFRAQKTTMWDFTADNNARYYFENLQKAMNIEN